MRTTDLEGISGDRASGEKARASGPMDDLKVLAERIAAVRKRMTEAAKNLEFEKAAELRDELRGLEQAQLALG